MEKKNVGLKVCVWEGAQTYHSPSNQNSGGTCNPPPPPPPPASYANECVYIYIYIKARRTEFLLALGQIV